MRHLGNNIVMHPAVRISKIPFEFEVPSFVTDMLFD